MLCFEDESTQFSTPGDANILLYNRIGWAAYMSGVITETDRRRKIRTTEALISSLLTSVSPPLYRTIYGQHLRLSEKKTPSTYCDMPPDPWKTWNWIENLLCWKPIRGYTLSLLSSLYKTRLDYAIFESVSLLSPNYLWNKIMDFHYFWQDSLATKNDPTLQIVFNFYISRQD
jgi:hypothetical protein